MPETCLGSCLCARVSYKLLTPPKAVTIAIVDSAEKVMGPRLPRTVLYRVVTYSSLGGSWISALMHHRNLCFGCFANTVVLPCFGLRKQAAMLIGYASLWARWTHLLGPSSKSMCIWNHSLNGQISPQIACSLTDYSGS